MLLIYFCMALCFTLGSLVPDSIAPWWVCLESAGRLLLIHFLHRKRWENSFASHSVLNLQAFFAAFSPENQMVKYKYFYFASMHNHYKYLLIWEERQERHISVVLVVFYLRTFKGQRPWGEKVLHLLLESSEERSNVPYPAIWKRLICLRCSPQLLICSTGRL